MPSLVFSYSFPKPLTLFWLALLVLLSLPACNSQTYQLLPTRPTPDDPLTRNTLQLQCRNVDALEILSFDAAMYWVDNTDRNLRDLLRDAEQRQTPISIGDRFQFTITRELEGRYFCGPNIGQTSPMVQLIAYPLIGEVPTSVTVTVQEGMDAILPPLISPGALLERYFIEWQVQRNGSLETLAQIEAPRSQATMMNGRYSVDPDSFALTIQTVQFEDRGLYLGVLSVRDPGGQQFTYDRLTMTGVTLDVYVPPTFLESPTNQVVSTVSTQSVSFTCRVQAYPRPIISWYHEEELLSDSDKYMISETNSMQDGMFVVWSMVVISDLTSEDSGQIRCVAGISVQNEEQPQSEESIAFLSVLGNVRLVTTFITLRNGAIFRLFLFRPIEAEVQLYIQYTDMESGNMTTEITRSRYSQLDEIAFFIENIPRSYTRFTIDVALISGDLRGPLHRDGTIHDLSVPTDLSETLTLYLAPSVSSMLILTAIVTVVTVWICFRCCSLRCAKLCFSCSRSSERSDIIDSFAPTTLERMRLVKNENIGLKSDIKGLRSDNQGLRVDNQELRDATRRLRSQEHGSIIGEIQEVDVIPAKNGAGGRLYPLIQSEEDVEKMATPAASDVAPVGIKGSTKRERSCIINFCCVGRDTEADREAREQYGDIKWMYKN